MSNLITSEVLKAQLGGIQAKINFDTLQPFVKTALRWFRRRVGSELLDSFEDRSSEANLDKSERELLELAQACICWYAYDLAFPHLKLRVGDMGLTKATANGTIAVTKWEYIDSRDANLQMLDLALEDFFTTLEELRPDAWISSEAYINRQAVFIRSAWEMARYVPTMGRNTRFFDQLIIYIERAETLYLRPLLTDSVFDALKTKWKTTGNLELTTAEAELLREIRPAIAHLAIYEALPYLSINVSPTGVSEQRSKDGLLEQVAPGGGVKDTLRRSFWTDANVYTARAKNFLDRTATAELFSGYYNAQKGQSAAPDDFTNQTLIIL